MFSFISINSWAINENNFVITSYTIKGNTKTKLRIIDRELKFIYNDTIANNQLNQRIQAYKDNLKNLDLFRSIDCKVDTLQNNNLVFNFIVVEYAYFDWQPNIALSDRNFNVWWDQYHHNLQRLNYSVFLDFENLQGLNRELIATLQYGFSNLAAINYTIPNIGNRQNNNFIISADYANSHQLYNTILNDKQSFYRNDNQFVYHKWHEELRYFFRNKIYSTYAIATGFTNLQINNDLYNSNKNLLPNQQSKTNFIENIAEYNYKKLDNFIYPLVGNRLQLSFNNKIGVLGNPFSQNYIYLFGSKYFNLKNNFFAIITSRNRLMLNMSNAFYFQNALGYNNDYLRGYEYYVINGSHFSVLKLETKKQIYYRTFNKNKKFWLSKIPVNFYPKIFSDMGYVNSISDGYSSNLRNKPLYSAGLGLDCRYGNYGFIRLEYSVNHLGQKGLFLHFNTL